jgi:hypothetical protein
MGRVVRWAAASGVTSPPRDAIANSDFWRPRWTSSFPEFARLRGPSVGGLREAIGPVAPDWSAPSGRVYAATGDHVISRLILIGAVLLSPFRPPGGDADSVILENARHSHSPNAQAAGVLAALIAYRAVATGELTSDLTVGGRMHSAVPLQQPGSEFERVARLLTDIDRGLVRPSAEELGPSGTALRSLVVGYSLARSAERDPPRSFWQEMSGVSPGEAAVAMALFGAKNGVEALPQGSLAKLELGWLADRLALDAMDLAERIREAGDHNFSHTDDLFARRYHLS